MRSKYLGGILLSILILLSTTSVLITISTISLVNAGATRIAVVADGYLYSTCDLKVDNFLDNSKVLATGSYYSWSYDSNGVPPEYVENHYVTLVAATQVGSGRVVVCGGGGSIGGARPDTWGFLDTFINWYKWLDNQNKRTILFYEGHAMYYRVSVPYNPYSTSDNSCARWADNMTQRGWTVTYTDNVPITSTLFENNPGIFYLDTIEVGYPFEASEIEALSNYVRGGGSLWMGAQSDYKSYGYFDNMNWVLDNLQTGIKLQDDEIRDDVNNFGGNFYAPRMYLTNHEANDLQNYGITVMSDPTYGVGLPGSTLTYKLLLTPTGIENDNIDLTATSDAGWGYSFSVNPVPVVTGSEGTFDNLTVTIPDNAPYSIQDNITVVATSHHDITKTDNLLVTAYSATWIQPSADDAQVVENVPTRIYGGSTNMYVGSSTTGYKNERSYLKFDLRQGLPTSNYTVDNIKSAYLYLYCFAGNGYIGKNIQIFQTLDNWDEEHITWNENQPAPGTLIATENISQIDNWYAIDVTAYVKAQYSGDKIVSFCMKAQTEGLASPDNFSYGFDTKEYDDPTLGTFIVFGVRPVASKFFENAGGPGDNVGVRAVVNNRGAVVDNYEVTISTQDGWTISPTSTTLLNVLPGENRIIPCWTIVAGGATPKTAENLILSVKSDNDNRYTTRRYDNKVWVGFEENILPGWNLVGFPATDAQTFPDNILPSLYYMWRWSAENGKYVSPSSTAPVVENIGYWVYIENKSWMVRIGVPFASDNVSLVGTKWNLVHFPATSTNTTPNQLFDGSTFYMWKWSAENKKYVSPVFTDPVVPGVAYWIWIDSSTTVHVPK
jgi:hypothetical protein